MAKPIELMPQPRDAREEMKRRLDAAPLEHADALLSGYDLLQQLHDSGTLDVLRGLLGAGDQVVKHAVGMATQPESVKTLSNLLLLAKLVGSVDPDALNRVVSNLQSMRKMPKKEPPSLPAILRRMSSRRSRRTLAALAIVLESVGKELGSGAR
ncbi:MAG TPA: DUF1641 domain-containing protein [Silvibacterium sp.]|jgi:uncharacterized protein YjgD (DUF1641 family)|nr:DUF1641 domain-containing protein [Silvibacterium sp.]